MTGIRDLNDHWIRVHKAYTHPKQWVRHVPGQGYSFTTDFSKRSMFTYEKAQWVIQCFHESFPNSGFIVTLDGI